MNLTNEAITIKKFVNGIMNWENPEISQYIIEEAFKDEPSLRNHLISKLMDEYNGNLNWLLMNIDNRCFQKFVDYAINR